jgi:hypothetical protein
MIDGSQIETSCQYSHEQITSAYMRYQKNLSYKVYLNFSFAIAKRICIVLLQILACYLFIQSLVWVRRGFK